MSDLRRTKELVSDKLLHKSKGEKVFLDQKILNTKFSSSSPVPHYFFKGDLFKKNLVTGFQTFELSDGRVVRHSFIFGLLALSFGFGAKHSFYNEIDTPEFTKVWKHLVGVSLCKHLLYQECYLYGREGKGHFYDYATKAYQTQQPRPDKDNEKNKNI